jgi:HPt (histidine-containing phosphotransfer) domain-containing protein
MNALKWDKDFALEQAADDAELLQELLDIFKDSLHSDIVQMEQGLAENSSAKVSSAAHSIKGAAASLGITGINEVAARIENDSREGGIAVAQKEISSLQDLLEELRKL